MERDRKEIERRADRLRGRERQTERNGTRKRRGRERERAQATDGSRQREIFIIALHYVIEHRVGGKSGGG